jgi:bacteriocin-like protein
MSEELKPQELENDQPAAPKELSEQELNEIAGGNGAGTGGHLGPSPGPGG